jgi:hypothetical protein
MTTKTWKEWIAENDLHSKAQFLGLKVCDKGYAQQRFEVSVFRPERGARPTFEYSSGIAYREERVSGKGWVRYKGPSPTKFNPDGTPKYWPKSTSVSDSSRWEASRPQPPALADLMWCLFSDYTGTDNVDGDFGEWAREFGYTDPGDAWDTWTAIAANTKKLRAVVGPAAFAVGVELSNEGVEPE